jgi:hypothetical protein
VVDEFPHLGNLFGPARHVDEFVDFHCNTPFRLSKRFRRPQGTVSSRERGQQGRSSHPAIFRQPLHDTVSSRWRDDTGLLLHSSPRCLNQRLKQPPGRVKRVSAAILRRSCSRSSDGR